MKKTLNKLNAHLHAGQPRFKPNPLQQQENTPASLEDKIAQINGNDRPVPKDHFSTYRAKLCQLLAELGFETSLQSPRHVSPLASPHRQPPIDLPQSPRLVKRMSSPRSIEKINTPPSSPRSTELTISSPPKTGAFISTKKFLSSTFSSKPRKASCPTAPTSLTTLHIRKDKGWLIALEVFKLLPTLAPPHLLTLPILKNPATNESESDFEMQAVLLNLTERLTTLAAQLNEINNDRGYAQIATLLTKLAHIYRAATHHGEMESACCASAFTADQGFFLLDNHVALRISGYTADGKKLPNPYVGASHFVSQEQGAHYKLANEKNSLDLGTENFIQTLLRQAFPDHASSFLTPTTYLNVSNVLTRQKQLLPPQSIVASLTIPGISLYEWLLIKETTEIMTRTKGREKLQEAICSWLNQNYMTQHFPKERSNHTPAQTIFCLQQKIYASQMPYPSEDRLLDFKDAKINSHSNRVTNVLTSLYDQEGIAQLERICAFVLTWPELTGGLSLYEVNKLVSVLGRLPTFFLNLANDDLKSIASDDEALKTVVNAIDELLVTFWAKLYLPGAVSLALASHMVNVEDGNGSNYQVTFTWETHQHDNQVTYTLKQWDIVWIDIGKQVLDDPIVANAAPSSPRGHHQTDVMHRPGMKCILFFLPPIKNAIIAPYTLNVPSIETLMMQSIVTVKEQHAAFEQLQRLQIIADDLEKVVGIPLKLHRRDLSQLYANMVAQQTFALSHPNGTFQDFFEFNNPLLAKAYETTRQSAHNRPTQAYLRLTDAYLEALLTDPISLAALKAHQHFSHLYSDDKWHYREALPDLITQFPWRINEHGKLSDFALEWLTFIADHFADITPHQIKLTPTEIEFFIKLASTKGANKVQAWLASHQADIDKHNPRLSLNFFSHMPLLPTPSNPSNAIKVPTSASTHPHL